MAPGRKGVYLAGAGTQSNMVRSNAIGTNWASAGGLGNADPGVGILNGAAFNTVTGRISSAAMAAREWISGAAAPPTIRLSATRLARTHRARAALPNHIGVHLWEGTANTAIGANGYGRNLISGNIGDGISVDSSFTTTIANNLIGLSERPGGDP